MKAPSFFRFLFLGTLFAAIFLGSLALREGVRTAPLAANSSGSILENQKKIYYSKNPGAQLRTSARAYLAGDLGTGEIILTKNEKEILPIASISKLMAALVASELYKPDDAIKVSKEAVATEGKNGSLHAGEEFKSGDLLYPLLLESSNDAAAALAERFSAELFLSKMNERARELLLLSTTYRDSSGLSPGNQSSASDLFRLTTYLKEKRPELLAITTERSATRGGHFWASNNQFLTWAGYLGGKSGYTGPARQTVVSLFSVPFAEESREIGIVLLGSADRKKDVESILGYLKRNITYGTAAERDALFAKVEEKVVPPPPPEPKEPDFVTLVLGGDIMLDRGIRSSVAKNFGGDYSELFSKLEILKNADIAFANLEGVASDRGTDIGNLYSFRMDPSVVPALRGAGITILSVANNHVGDFGREAYEDTLSRLTENEILATGGGMTREEAERPAIVEKYGMRIGFLGFSDKGPGGMAASSNRSGILLASDPRFDDIVANAARQVDALVVSFHFGEEYQDKHNGRQEVLAHRAIDNGAKLVVGHHPHVMQDFEVYNGGYIAYSLGNLIFDQRFSERTMQGLLLGVKLYKDGSMSVQKNIVKLSPAFQPDKIILGKEEKNDL
ncbi:MAG: CapA family protein [Patescibacteria group bacterium]